MNNGTKKRFLSLLLALTMLVSLSPAVYAEGELEQDSDSITLAEEVYQPAPEPAAEEYTEPVSEETQQEEPAEEAPAETEPEDENTEAGNAEETTEEPEEQNTEEAKEENTEEEKSEEEKQEEEKTEEKEAKPEEQITLTMVTFTSTQELALTVSSQLGEVLPANELEIAYYLSGMAAAPAAELPAAENSAEEELSEEATSAEEIASEAPAAEAPTIEEPAAEAPITEEPAAEAPVAEELAAEEPVAEEEPVSEAPAAESPAAEELASEAPAAEEALTEEPTAEPSEEPIAEDANTEELPEEAPTAEEPEEIIFTAAYLLQPGAYTYTAYADYCIRVKNEAFEVTENASDFGIEIKLEELPYGLKGMPAGYELSDDELADKKKLEEHDVVETLSGLIPGVNYVDGEVMFLSDDEEYVNDVAEAYSAQLESYSYGVAVIKLQTASVLEAVTVAADQDMPLPMVEPNYITQVYPIGSSGRQTSLNSAQSTDDVPQLQNWKSWYDSTEYPDPCLSDPTSSDYQYYHDIVNTYEAWGVTTGADVNVAVIDSGIADHEDLSVTHWTTGTNGSHGTHVAGIIAAAMGNGIGGAGVAPDANIFDVRIINDQGTYYASDLCAAVNKVIENGTIQIMNMSIGGVVYSADEEKVLKDAIENHGITAVVAMGNDGTNIKSYPAAYNISGLIAVGSTTESGVRSSFSNYGYWQDVAAPGSDIYSTIPSDYGAYGFMSGTSMATPVVSGVCALYMSVYGNPGPAAMESIISSATTNGVIDASKLFISDKTAPEIDIAINGTAEYGSKITIKSNSGVSTEENGAIVYTTDGKTPSVKGGKVQGTTRVYDSEKGIEVTSENGFTLGKKVTIKAACVSGMGILSDVTSKTFTVGYAAATKVEILNAPDQLIPGKTAVLEFKVLPEGAKQSVTWEITEREGCPGTSIDNKTSTLKTAANDFGSVTLKATSSDGEANASVTIAIEKKLPVNSLKLSPAKATLKFGNGAGEAITITPTALDKNKEDITESVVFQWKSSNQKVATVDEDGTVTAAGKGTATISCTALDGSKKVAKCTITVVQLVESISITGQERIAPGKNATYKVSILPSAANNKKVNWSLSGETPAGVTISTSGQVKVPKTVTEGTITIIATAKDGSEVYGEKEIDIAPMAASISIYCYDSAFSGGGCTYNQKTGAVTSATLWAFQPAYWYGSEEKCHGTEDGFNDASIQLTATATGSDEVPVQWISSNTSVATVDDGLVQSVNSGTAKITCKALDGSGKSASVSIKVIIPASGVTVVSGSNSTLGDNIKIISPGKSVTNKAVVNSAFGKPTISKVSWSHEVYVFNDSRERQTEIEQELTNSKYITLSSSGTLSVKSAIAPYANDYKVYIGVFAKTEADGSNLEGYVEYQVSAEATQKLLIEDYTVYKLSDSSKVADGYFVNEGKYVTSGTVTYNSGGECGSQIIVPIYYENKNYKPIENYVVKSSNPNVAGATIKYSETSQLYYASIITNNNVKTSTAKITVTATDGSNKSVTITVKVK